MTSTRKKTRRYLDEPLMSEKTILMSVEDLIGMAMGPTDKNIVNFKMVQMILYILARQLRMLEQQVELRTDMVLEPMTTVKLTKEEKAAMKEAKRDAKQYDGTDARDKDTRKAETGTSKERDKERATSKERERDAHQSAKDKEMADKAESKEGEQGKTREEKERERAEKADAKEGEKGKTREEKERERAGKAEAKEGEKGKTREEKERERAGKAEAKEGEKGKTREEKERERAGKAEAKEGEKGKTREEKGREKAEKAAAKEGEKGKTREEKEREKAEKAADKDKQQKEKEKDRTEKGKDKTEKGKDKTEKEKDKTEKDKAERAGTKEADKMGKAAEKEAKEQEKADKAAGGKGTREKDESGKLKKLQSPTSGGSSIEITETKKGKDKVLGVGKVPATKADARQRVGSIEVVTRSQFELLKSQVEKLAEDSGPLPWPTMPDNKKLRSDLARGSASLTDTMQALQVTARVSAAEEAISRMADLLTQLAATGALPEDVASRVVIGLREAMVAAADSARTREAAGPGAAGGGSRPMAKAHTQRADVRTAEIQQSLTPRKSVGIDPGALKPGAARPSSAGRSSVSAAMRPSAGAGLGAASSIGDPCVSHKEMDDSLQELRADLFKNIQNMTSKATGNADVAANVAKAVADKLDIAMKLDNRISTLYTLTTDYAEQLSGFDAGLTTQMQSFQEQMAQMRADMQGGITLLESANNNAETAAVMELTERYEGLASELERTAHAHQSLTAFQKQLGDELRSLVECVEMLREQKADRDEVLDGLRDKADISRLAGLLTDEVFMASRAELEARLNHCYDKFRKQDSVWMGALHDLSQVTETKAELLQLMSLRENTQDQLNEMNDMLNKLAEKLGEPMAAILTRKLARDATCGVCMGTALMEPTEKTFGSPAPLPPIALRPRPRPLGQEAPCLADVISDWEDLKSHTCKRWVGGSHTLMREGLTRERAPPPPRLPPVPTRRYAGVGIDGQLYMMEEELQPCEECNQLLYEEEAAAAAAEPGFKDTGPVSGAATPSDAGPETGGGDQGPRISQLNLDDVK